MSVTEVQQRVERLSDRLRGKPGKRLTGRSASDPVRAAKMRKRRERLEAERQDWERLVREHHGCVARIARAMGCEHTTAEYALWDLGLWPEVVRERGR